ncbi:MAG: alpha-ketoacid dehydrogenase subunit beta [Proteobacteria bacterium]|nr:MAG: alpha-ketoacid dehydrogenase subunit beta [Pseudomonadota bacterium]
MLFVTHLTDQDSTTTTYKQALFESMDQVMQRNSNVVIFGQGVDDHKGMFGTTYGLVQKYGKNRVMDTPLAEEGVTGIAVGAALNGLYPILTHLRCDFALLTMNQVINLAAKYKYSCAGKFEVPMLIRMVIGRSWGQGAQHSQSPQSLFAHIPGLKVVMPASPQSIMDTYRYCAEEYRGPVISIEHRLMYDLKFKKEPSLKNPFTSRLVRPGKDITIVATSIMVVEAIRAAEHLRAHANIDCEIIDLHCISHPDREMITHSVKKTGKLLIADTSWINYGVGAEVCRFIAETCPSALKAPVKTVGLAAATCPTAKSLEDLYYPNLTTLCNDIATLAVGRPDHGISLPDERSMADVYKKFKGPF